MTYRFLIPVASARSGDYPGVCADVLLEGTREQSDRRGLFRMASDVITFVTTSLFYGQCLEAIKFAIS
jgi:hypothetical protein